jgi:hypothetical protein
MTLTELLAEKEGELIELGHGFQEMAQPAKDGESGYPWGTGYWSGIEFAKEVLSSSIRAGYLLGLERAAELVDYYDFPALAAIIDKEIAETKV